MMKVQDLDEMQCEAVLGTVGAWTPDMIEWMRDNGLGVGDSALSFRLTDRGRKLRDDVKALERFQDRFQ